MIPNDATGTIDPQHIAAADFRGPLTVGRNPAPFAKNAKDAAPG
jgi:hypothetical protein